MDWKNVGQLVAPLAPTLGAILGDLIPFPGGSLVGRAVGTMIASQFGVADTPEAVAGAITSNPNEVVLAKLAAAAQEAQAKWPAWAAVAKARAEVEVAHFAAVKASLVEVNATMRAQIGHEHWFFSGWRPACGWLFVGYAAIFGALLMGAIAQDINAGADKSLAIISTHWPLIVGFFGALGAVVGIYIGARSAEKTKMAAAPPAAPI